MKNAVHTSEYVVGAFLRPKRIIWQWVIPRCPICGEEHAHYGGMLTDDPRHHLGRRTYLCRFLPLDNLDELLSQYTYTLVDGDAEGTERMMSARH